VGPSTPFEFRKHAEHVEKVFARCRAGVDWLLGRLQGRAASLDRAHDVLKVSNAAREPINAGDHQHVAFTEEVQDNA
jgi:hypothetical protein